MRIFNTNPEPFSTIGRFVCMFPTKEYLEYLEHLSKKNEVGDEVQVS